MYHFHSYEAIWTNFHTVTHFFFLCDLPVWFIFLLFLSFETSLFSSSMAGTHYTSVSDTMSEVAQPYPTLCDPMDCSLPGSIHGIFQARILEWVAISFSRGSSRPRDRTQVSRLVGRCFTIWATREISIKKLRPWHLLPSLHANRWGKSGNTGRFYTPGLLNHCRWWLQPWN